MPALVVLLRGGRASRIAAACGYLLFALAPMWWTPWTFTTVEYGFHGLVTLTANCFLIAGVGFLAYMAVRAWHHGRAMTRHRTRPAHLMFPAW